MKEMFLKFAKIIEVSEKTRNIENRTTRKYVASLVDMLVHIGVDIDFIEPIVDKCIKQEICVSEDRINLLNFFKDRVYMVFEKTVRCNDCEHYVDCEITCDGRVLKGCEHPKIKRTGSLLECYLETKQDDFCIYFQKREKSEKQIEKG